MKIFDRPNKAFHDYEQSMMRPRRWPPTRHDVPTLWVRAKALFAAMLETAGSAVQLAQCWRFTRADRREILSRLVPVEKIVRLLMMVEALTFLVMTPEGCAMRRAAMPVTPPAPPAPPSAPHATRIVMPGWHTIAALQPRVDPRVVEREQREALERARQQADLVAHVGRRRHRMALQLSRHPVAGPAPLARNEPHVAQLRHRRPRRQQFPCDTRSHPAPRPTR